jgi:hypothetical protein
VAKETPDSLEGFVVDNSLVIINCVEQRFDRVLALFPCSVVTDSEILPLVVENNDPAQAPVVRNGGRRFLRASWIPRRCRLAATKQAICQAVSSSGSEALKLSTNAITSPAIALHRSFHFATLGNDGSNSLDPGRFKTTLSQGSGFPGARRSPRMISSAQ